MLMLGKLEGKTPLGNLGRYREILNYNFEKQTGGLSGRLLDLTGSGQGLVAACTEGLGFMDCRQFLDY
jgi:hypothetical protein